MPFWNVKLGGLQDEVHSKYEKCLHAPPTPLKNGFRICGKIHFRSSSLPQVMMFVMDTLTPIADTLFLHAGVGRGLNTQLWLSVGALISQMI